MSDVFFGINKTGQLYVDATVDASITYPNISNFGYTKGYFSFGGAVRLRRCHSFQISKNSKLLYTKKKAVP